MKYTLLLIALFSIIMAYPQVVKTETLKANHIKVIENYKEGFKTKCYADGFYKSTIDADEDGWGSYKCTFNVKDNCIHGPVCFETDTGWVFGNYYMDSLWTLFANPLDTTFRVGEWRFLDAYKFGGVFLRSEYQYQIPYGPLGFYNQVYQNLVGDTIKHKIFKKGFGLVLERDYNTSTGALVKQVEITPAYIKTEKFSNDTLVFFSYQQGDKLFFIDNNKKQRYYGPDWSIGVADTSENADYINCQVSVGQFPSKNYELNDNKNGVIIKYDHKGNILIEYKNRRGKTRYRKIRR